MLFDFHQQQNAKKPNSVHATYLVTGRKRIPPHPNGAHSKDGEDVAMRSSPFMSSMPEPDESAEEPIGRTAVVLVREEELQSACARTCGTTALTSPQKPVPISSTSRPSTYTAWNPARSRYARLAWNEGVLLTKPELERTGRLQP
tara:strand:- start:9396 stop:9830 length:435 start_codon:yes stop_codon:yes gene_type:complete